MAEWACKCVIMLTVRQAGRQSVYKAIFKTLKASVFVTCFLCSVCVYHLWGSLPVWGVVVLNLFMRKGLGIF